MSDRAALLAAICAHPDEDTPRLAYADWLDEHADTVPAPAAARAHAQFIRDDIAMWLREEYDPLRLRWVLIEKPKREAEAWVRDALPALHWGNFARDPLFRRGFPWTVTVPPASAPHAPADLTVAAPIERLGISHCGGHITELLRAAPWRRRLRAVEFDHRGNRSPTDTLSRIAFERLDRLAFRHDAITTAEARELVAAPLFRGLAAFRIVRARVGTVIPDALAHANRPGSLRELHLVECGVAQMPLADFLNSPAASGLESLSVGGDRTNSSLKFRAFGLVTDMPPLRALDVSDESPGELGIEFLLGSPFPPVLRRLDLSRCSLNRDRVRALAGGAFGALRVLWLYGNSVGNDGAVALAQSPHLSGLLVLDLGFAQVGDEGIGAILESPLADGLVLLDLTGSPASAEMKEVLKARMGDRVRL
ncbi:TIGR02996 domain-containing protein [Frigoriglobus tundricola]|uniref:TIGR02996 domain-containing protein n=1 Tax=Frigoriglobus tundricola TaxID=2774151 RepID=A0A6M5YN77_9BACT|nr:TIGR02996 domain-containing protein [Frigoriglobus tundricola]QJW95014.1 hypothetical protein FTUN_2540 [Frigoriglobus tundricola]